MRYCTINSTFHSLLGCNWPGISPPTFLNLFVLASPIRASQPGICRGLQRWILVDKKFINWSSLLGRNPCSYRFWAVIRKINFWNLKNRDYLKGMNFFFLFFFLTGGIKLFVLDLNLLFPKEVSFEDPTRSMKVLWKIQTASQIWFSLSFT